MAAPAEIIAFLHQARQHSWPANVHPSTKPELYGFQETHYRDGDWAFYDTYGGSVTDIGFQVIFYQQVQVWGVAYRGGIIQNAAISPTEVFQFLIKALSAPLDVAVPLRGPSAYSAGAWGYQYRVSGEFHSFLAVERILYHGVLVYERVLCGGTSGSVPYGAAIPAVDALFDT